MQDPTFPPKYVHNAFFRNPTFIAAFAFEPVEPSRYRRVEHARDVLWLLPHFRQSGDRLSVEAAALHPT
jgi:hypothetical protein